jgi:hypothetical protein
MPQLANREPREQVSEGSDALGRARQVVREIRENGRVSCLDATIREEILAAFPEIRRDFGKA